MAVSLNVSLMYISIVFRLLFDSEESPNLEQDCFLHDIHCVGSALKMYFRYLISVQTGNTQHGKLQI